MCQLTDYPLTYLIAKVLSTAVIGALIAWVCVLENIKKSLFCWHWSRYTPVLSISRLLLEECTSLWRTETLLGINIAASRPSYSSPVGDGSLTWLIPSLLKQASSARPSALNTSSQQWETNHVAHSRIRSSIWLCTHGFLWQHLSGAGQAEHQQEEAAEGGTLL